jgi:hypothetical protein
MLVVYVSTAVGDVGDVLLYVSTAVGDVQAVTSNHTSKLPQHLSSLVVKSWSCNMAIICTCLCGATLRDAVLGWFMLFSVLCAEIALCCCVGLYLFLFWPVLQVALHGNPPLRKQQQIPGPRSDQQQQQQ